MNLPEKNDCVNREKCPVRDDPYCIMECFNYCREAPDTDDLAGVKILAFFEMQDNPEIFGNIEHYFDVERKITIATYRHRDMYSKPYQIRVGIICAGSVRKDKAILAIKRKIVLKMLHLCEPKKAAITKKKEVKNE